MVLMYLPLHHALDVFFFFFSRVACDDSSCKLFFGVFIALSLSLV